MDDHTVNLLQDINSWPQMPDESRVSHIFREENYLTNFITVGSSKRIATEYVMNNLLSELYALLKLNGRRCESNISFLLLNEPQKISGGDFKALANGPGHTNTPHELKWTRK